MRATDRLKRRAQKIHNPKDCERQGARSQGAVRNCGTAFPKTASEFIVIMVAFSRIVGVAVTIVTTVVDANEGSFWHAATGGTSIKGDGFDVTCTEACATAAAGECDADAFWKDLDNMAGTEAGFKEAKPDAMICAGYYPDASPWAPSYYYNDESSSGLCYYANLRGGPGPAPSNCDAKSSNYGRLCPCQCGAGSYQPLSGIVRSCTRYVPIAVGGTQREPFFHAPSTLRRPFLRAAMARLEGTPCDGPTRGNAL